VGQPPQAFTNLPVLQSDRDTLRSRQPSPASTRQVERPATARAGLSQITPTEMASRTVRHTETATIAEVLQQPAYYLTTSTYTITAERTLLHKNTPQYRVGKAHPPHQ
jgi:hypothetical protein